MGNKVGYLIDLTTLQFDETSSTSNDNYQSWIQAMPLGKYDHPVYGEVEFSPDRINKFATNVNSNVRGTELDIDFDHKEYSGEAAGWIKSAEAKPNGLWILVEWTKKAYELIKSKAYRYFSPEFDDEWSHPKTGVKYQDVLFGGGITNRPFLKDILPLNLSETFTTQRKHMFTEEQLAELRTSLGLSETATPEEVFTALSTRLAAPAQPPEAQVPAVQETDDVQTPAPVLSEAEKAKLLSENPGIQNLVDLVTQLSETNSTITKELTESRVSSAVNKLSETAEKKGYLIPVTTKAGITKLFSEAPNKQFSETLTKVFSDMLNDLPQKGETDYKPANGNNGGKSFSDRVAEYVAAKNVTFAVAADVIAREDKDAYNAHRLG